MTDTTSAAHAANTANTASMTVARRLVSGACAAALALSLAAVAPIDQVAPTQFEGGRAYAATVKAGSVSSAAAQAKSTSKKTAQAVTLKLKSATAVTLQVGKTRKIAVSASKGAKVTYSTSKKAVAAVSSKGVITAKKAGSATIAVKATYKGKTVSKSVKVTVKAVAPVASSQPSKPAAPSTPAKPAVPAAPSTSDASATPAQQLVSLEDATVDPIPAQTYTGSLINPKLTVRVGGKTLVSGTDYICYWYNNRAVGTASVRIQGINKAGYCGSKTVTFQILKSLQSLSVSSIPTQLYTGKCVSPAISIKDGSKTLASCKDYVCYFYNNRNVGTATVIVKGINSAGYKDSVLLSYSIVKARSLSGAGVSRVSDQTYTGKAITPSLTVTYAGKKLVKGTDYKLSYRNNVKAGTATITVTGCGLYTGTRTVNFTIKPKTSPQPAPQPNYGNGAYGMNGEEYAVAKDIFNAYNDWRARRGLNRVAWDDSLFTTAYQSSVGCARLGYLKHGTAIANYGNVRTSDILQRGWKMSGSRAVEEWENSPDHRQMMQCDTATSAGVGVYNAGGWWYYTIVYNFSGITNKSGS